MLTAFRAFAKSWAARGLLGLIILAMAGFGISRYGFQAVKGDEVIRAGSRVTPSYAFKREYENYKKQLEQQQNGGQPIPPDVAEANHLDQIVLNGLATREAFAELLSKGGVRPSDKLVLGQIEKIPAFFDPITEGWQVGPQMALRRWYDTTVELPDGDALVFSGQVFPGEQATEVEHYDAASDVIWTLPSSATLTMQNYPRMFLMGDGRIARVGREAQTMFFDPASNAWSTGPSMLAGDRARGSAVLMPDGHTVLAVGGAVNDVTTNTAELVDLAASQPSWSYTGSMNEPRRSLNAVLLPDGKVLAIGGNRGTHNYDDPVFNSEMYDPATGIWTLGPSQAAPRAYHSTALLLPDGRVLSAGQTDGPMQTTAEIYSPPYLFAGPRPVITSAPTNVAYGSAFTVGTDRAGDVGDVVLIRPGAVTHGVSFDQRSVPLPFTAQEGSLSVDTPTSTQAPPGWYMLFLVDNTGVPSVANWVHLPEA